MIKIKNKKGMDTMWWTIIGAVLAIVAGGMLLYLYYGGFSTGGKNLAILSSCKTLGGECQPKCPPGYASYEGYGCPDDKTTKFCCIPEDKLNEKKGFA